jgi:hypothetical protein
MKAVQLKYLAFYGGTIAFVLGLFTVVTNYGETHLKAAQSVEGKYLLALPTTNKCGGGVPVTLAVQQSGMYVAAALVNPALPHSQTAFKSMTLSGRWQNQQLKLAGKVPVGVLCDKAKNKREIAVKIEGAIAKPQAFATQPKSSEASTLTGTLFLNSASFPLMAQRQPVLKEEAK